MVIIAIAYRCTTSIPVLAISEKLENSFRASGETKLWAIGLTAFRKLTVYSLPKPCNDTALLFPLYPKLGKILKRR